MCVIYGVWVGWGGSLLIWFGFGGGLMIFCFWKELDYFCFLIKILIIWKYLRVCFIEYVDDGLGIWFYCDGGNVCDVVGIVNV